MSNGNMNAGTGRFFTIGGEDHARIVRALLNNCGSCNAAALENAISRALRIASEERDAFAVECHSYATNDGARLFSVRMNAAAAARLASVTRTSFKFLQEFRLCDILAA